MVPWELGKFDELLHEASTIQAKLPTNLKGLNEERLAKIFAKLELEGKINAAMKLLDQHSNRGVLPLSQSTINEVKRKHPEASEADPSLLIDGRLICHGNRWNCTNHIGWSTHLDWHWW